MKKLFLYACAIVLFVACKNNATNDGGAVGNGKESAVASTPGDMPYQLPKPWMDWKTNSNDNAVTVMKFLKAWENKKVDESLTYFADSTRLIFDNYNEKLGQDSLRAFINMTLKDYKTVKIDMEDWESVISADKSEEWVTVWYKQSWVDMKGKADSVSITDEARLKDGKMNVFVEYTMHYPKKKEEKKM